MKNKIYTGQSLFEVVIAVGISALIITGIAAAALNSIQNSSYARDKNLATNYVQETMEWLRQVRDKETQAFAGKAIIGGVYCLSSLPSSVTSWPSLKTSCSSAAPISNTIFVRKIEFIECTGCPPNVVRVKTTVTWKDSKGSHDVVSTTDLSVK